MKKSILVILVLLVIFLVPAAQLNLWGEEGEIFTPQEKKNIELLKRLFEDAWNQGKLEVVDEILSPDCIVTVNHAPESQPGPGPMKKEIQQEKKDNEIFKITIHEIFAKKDKVAFRYIVEQKPRILDQVFIIYCLGIAHFSGDKIVKLWYVFDEYRLYKEAGFKIIPPEKMGETTKK